MLVFLTNTALDKIWLEIAIRNAHLQVRLTSVRYCVILDLAAVATLL